MQASDYLQITKLTNAVCKVIGNSMSGMGREQLKARWRLFEPSESEAAEVNESAISYSFISLVICV